MQSSKSAWRTANAILGAALSIGLTAIFDLGFHPPLLMLPVAFVVFWSALFLFLDWLFVKRPEKVKENVPITGKERRRRQREFYDSLPR